MKSLLFLPVVGEAFLPVKPFEAVKTGNFNSKTNILAGATADEGSIFVFNWFDKLNSSSPKFNQNAKDYVFHEIDNLKYLESEEIRKRAIDFYLSNETNVNLIKNKTSHLFGDYILICPMHFMLKDIMLWSGDNKVYMYKLTYKSSQFNSIYANETWMGIPHGSDLEFVFGLPLKYPKIYSKQDYQFSLLVLNLWTNFAKTG